jgi:hypothetical protein
MKAVIHGYSMPRAKDVPYESENLFIVIDLPFIPCEKTAIKVTPHGEYLNVAQVMWNCDQPNEIQVFTEEPMGDLDKRQFAEMLREGWRVGTGEGFEEKDSNGQTLSPWDFHEG